MKTFTEKQKFTQWWLWLILFGLLSIPICGLFLQFIMDKPFGDNPTSDGGLMLFALFMLLFLGFFYSITLKTEIDEQGIRMIFFPFVHKSIPWEKVENAEIVTYSIFIGWGIRLFTPYGTAYNIKGNKGLALTLKEGTKLMIGTQKAVELQAFIKGINLTN